MNTLWDLVVAYEDGNEINSADVRALSADDRAILVDEMDRVNAKNVREGKMDVAGRLASLGI